MLAEFRQHAGRMPQPHDPLAEAQQPFEDVVDRQVARGAGQDLAAAADRLADDLHDGRRLAGAGRAVDQADVAGREGELHGIELHLVERAVQRAHGPIDAELRLPLAEEHVAEDRRAVAAEHAGLFQGGPLPLRGHFVEGNVDPPGVVLAQFVRQAVDGHGDRGLAPLADHAAIGKLRAVLVRRKDHGAADVQAGPGQQPAGAAKKLHDEPPAQAGILVRNHQVDQAVAGLLGLGGREFSGLLGHALGLGPAFQVQEPGRGGQNGPPARTVARRSAAMRARTRRSPNIWPSRAFSSRASQPSGTSTTAAGPRNSIRPTRFRSSPPTRSRKSKTSGLLARRGRGSMCRSGMRDQKVVGSDNPSPAGAVPASEKDDPKVLVGRHSPTRDRQAAHGYISALPLGSTTCELCPTLRCRCRWWWR